MIKYFEKNTQGRDFVVGDIHGEFTKLQRALDIVKFDGIIDRLFTMGDLVDRGTESEEFWDYLRKPWFHSTRGNHEQMLIDSVEQGPTSHSSAMHAMNGGMWLYGLSEIEQKCYAEMMKDLPLAIEIDTDNGKIGLVHGEVPLGDWSLFKSMYESNQERFESVALWARSKIDRKDTSVVKGIDHVYVGHTPVVKGFVKLGNVTYIDEGVCFTGKYFNLIQIN